MSKILTTKIYEQLEYLYYTFYIFSNYPLILLKWLYLVQKGSGQIVRKRASWDSVIKWTRVHAQGSYDFVKYTVVQSQVVSNSMQPHGLQHTRLSFLRVCSSSWTLCQWLYLTISSSVISFSFAFNLSQHQGLSQRVSSLHQVAKVLELQLKHQPFQWIFRVNFL